MLSRSKFRTASAAPRISVPVQHALMLRDLLASGFTINVGQVGWADLQAVMSIVRIGATVEMRPGIGPSERKRR